MKNGVFLRLVLAALMLVLVGLVACGGSEATSTPEATAPARRTRSATTEPGASAQATQDPLDDSTDTTNEPEPKPTAGAQPTQDPLDDSTDNGGGAKPTTPAEAAAHPPTQNGQVVVAGTGWILTDDETQTFFFCQDGYWKNIKGGDIINKSGTYEVKADTVLLTNASDKQVTTYKMGWKPRANVLELNDGKAPLHLQYDKPTNCTA